MPRRRAGDKKDAGRPPVARQTYFACECADLLGMHVETFYRQVDRLVAQGMPSPIFGGKIRIPRSAFDRWLASARKPAIKTAANDDVDLSSPVSLEQHRTRLARVYR